MVVPLTHIVEACNEAGSLAEELAGRLAEQDTVNQLIWAFCAHPLDKCRLTLFKRCVGTTGEWPQVSVM